MGTINSNDRIAATLYSLGTWFVSGIYVYIPCIKEIVSLAIIIIIIMQQWALSLPVVGKSLQKRLTKCC
jgi:hypothetical protein